ncbi:hypothetical protein DACRYDRAFT_21930 [Dacryopinax primogenitus]|uniref:Uncharacterized protein n=1 Tax=Dacryopinax primogenitus (strain DJM 731) TaxID=1858805 RepID=M5G8N2_DACPD|nr:uncharacterized protein DACRYDRAFT_21930 [Dacryopinax primogenitus]EJU02192.1 hypothetical protein DACRYDRAFT_21930 [Dacryopinax primogenitus]
MTDVPDISAGSAFPNQVTDHDHPSRYNTFRTRPTSKQIALARLFVEHGAPNAERLHKDITMQEMREWLDQAAETTPMPATPTQLVLARHLVENGAPCADELKEGMTFNEMRQWLFKVQMAGNYFPRRSVPLGLARKQPSSNTQYELARRLADSAGIQLTFDPTNSTRGEVSDFIARCRVELLNQGKPAFIPSPEERDMPPSPGQKRKATYMGINIPENATKGSLSDLILAKQKELGVQWRVPGMNEEHMKEEEPMKE